MDDSDTGSFVYDPSYPPMNVVHTSKDDTVYWNVAHDLEMYRIWISTLAPGSDIKASAEHMFDSGLTAGELSVMFIQGATLEQLEVFESIGKEISYKIFVVSLHTALQQYLHVDLQTNPALIQMYFGYQQYVSDFHPYGLEKTIKMYMKKTRQQCKGYIKLIKRVVADLYS